MWEGETMSDTEKDLTEAEKQVLRLEQLRSQKEKNAKASAERTYLPHKTAVERTTRRIQAMRPVPPKPKPAKADKTKKLPKAGGRSKSARLSDLQIAVLERLRTQDKRLGPAPIIRIALNRILGIENSFAENQLESRIFEILRQSDPRS
jgi:hypothetical protein